MTIHIALFEPEIPPNTGNIIRLCANTCSVLHLIEPLGFDMDTKKLRRAGLDYHEFTDIQRHADYQSFLKQVEGQRIFGLSTKGSKAYTDIHYQSGDVLLFGPETRGLPESIREHTALSELLTIPMAANSRSLNLSNSVAIVCLEAWRQLDFNYS
ncbi:MAG: tRNA (uridine(34)/cytosine(34)/5-carboxymethylaminomethyluridine(34)-2'-O)-methyltransferase TrmL [Pseudomonadales bacterium]|nr:tRNA (uridine(34)/cytosine(34)/5-carboxymethylaminomethyluridine(34)-2'-O)-methyltransferase TrmL [Pseudomonadales bacterium]